MGPSHFAPGSLLSPQVSLSPPGEVVVGAGQGLYAAVSLCLSSLLTHFQCPNMGCSTGHIPAGDRQAPAWVLHGPQSVPLGSICSGMGLLMGCSPSRGVPALAWVLQGPQSLWWECFHHQVPSALTLVFPSLFSLSLPSPLSVWRFLPFFEYIFPEAP